MNGYYYNEIKHVDFDKPVWNDKNGHFMNMMDKNAGLMGVGCTPNTVTVHNYNNGSAITIFILRKSI